MWTCLTQVQCSGASDNSFYFLAKVESGVISKVQVEIISVLKKFKRINQRDRKLPLWPLAVLGRIPLTNPRQSQQLFLRTVRRSQVSNFGVGAHSLIPHGWRQSGIHSNQALHHGKHWGRWRTALDQQKRAALLLTNTMQHRLHRSCSSYLRTNANANSSIWQISHLPTTSDQWAMMSARTSAWCTTLMELYLSTNTSPQSASTILVGTISVNNDG